MTFCVSEIARILGVDITLVKTWASAFSDYLKPPANPPKGTPRTFCIEDLRVLAYVALYWEDEPDIEEIKCGINSGYHYDTRCSEITTAATPLFREPPDDLNQEWRHGAVFSGMSEVADMFALAESYKVAGDRLADVAVSSDSVFDSVCPVIFNYRHATELYLKATIPHPEKNHDLLGLLRKFKGMLRSEFRTTIPSWMEDIIIAFHDCDPKGITFRYGGGEDREVWIDLLHIKTLMGWMAEAFRKIRQQRGLPFT